MTDRELLEFAAKAAGYALGDGWGELRDGIIVNGTGHGDGDMWDPLNDDGDVFRLAVHIERYVKADFWSRVIAIRSVIDFMTAPREATRRAIVRAAAEIGKAMTC